MARSFHIQAQGLMAEQTLQQSFRIVCATPLAEWMRPVVMGIAGGNGLIDFLLSVGGLVRMVGTRCKRALKQWTHSNQPRPAIGWCRNIRCRQHCLNSGFCQLGEGTKHCMALTMKTSLLYPSRPGAHTSCATVIGSLTHSLPSSPSLLAVIEGMDVVYKVEAVGSSSGKPSKKVVIADSGELKEVS